MKHIALATAVLLGMAFLTPSVVFSPAEAKITPGSQVNGGGNEPKGEANGVPTAPATNPAGNEPGGHNK
jgi:hypothetical protein